MRIFIINSVYKLGSTGKIVLDTKNYYESKGHSVMVAYGMGDKTKDPHTFKFCSTVERYIHYYLCKFGYNPYQGSPFTVRRIIKAIKAFNPDIVHLHCLNSHCVDLYGLLGFLSSHDYKVVVTHHAEFYYTGSCPHAYDCNNWINSQCSICSLPKKQIFNLFNVTHHDLWLKMFDSFSGFKKENLVFTAVSPWVKQRADLSPITNNFDCVTVMNGLEINKFHFTNDKDVLDKGTYDYIAFHASASFSDRINDPKGGRYILELAKLNPTVLFVVAALHINMVEKPLDNVLLWGPAKSDIELVNLYSQADITVICSKRETFSMITAESLCCGTPVIGFEAGGPESIAIPSYSQFVEYGNVFKLNKAMHSLLKRKYNKVEISSQAMSVYSKDIMSSNYLNVYNELLNS